MSASRIKIKKLLNNIPCISTHHLRVLIMTPLYFSVKFLFILAFKWENTGKECVKQHTQGPHVHLASIVFCFSNKLWCHVGWCSAKNLKPFSIFTKRRKSKIYEFDHICTIFNKNIIKFHISMSNTSSMQIIKSFSYLFKKLSANTFFNYTISTLLFDVLMYTNSLNEISNNAYLLSGFN